MADNNTESQLTPTIEKAENVHKRNTFVFYRDWYDIIRQLDDKTAIDVCKAIMASAFEDDYVSKELTTKTLMLAINPQIKRDIEKWNEVRSKRSDAGRKHRGNQHSVLEQNGTNGTNGTSVPNVPTMEQMEQDGTNGTVNVNVNVSKDTNVSMLDIKEDASASKKEKPLWKTSFDEYKRLFEEAKQELLSDTEFRAKQEDYYPNIDYEKSLEKSMDYWSTEEVWKKVARERSQTIMPKERIKKNFDKNRVYKSFNSKYTDTRYPNSVEDVKDEDVCNSWNTYIYWAEKSGAYKLYEKMKAGFPENNQQYQHLIAHTIGGARAFAYVVLVFMRDGWDKYNDERGFMWIYSNYIKANELYKE